MIATQQSNSTPTSPRRRPSISNPIAWLARTSAHSHSHSTPAAISGPMLISEPQLVNDFYAPINGSPCMHPRYGILGSGATVVRTPKDALTRAAAVPPPPHDPPGVADDDGSFSSFDEPEPASPASPPLPPLPFTSKSSPNLPGLGGIRDVSPSPPNAFHPAPLNIEPTPPQQPFTPVLLAPVPDMIIDPTSLIVTLETSVSALRTTYATLTSRPSHLAEYLKTLAYNAREREKRKFRDTLVEEEEGFDEDEDDGYRLSSPHSPFTSVFNAHLANAGLLSQSPGLLHLFLDRPSAPYVYILAYLRTPTEHPSLPRAVTLHDRLEELLELRDEARYLGLEELHRLCCEAIRRRQGHVRGASSQGQTRGRADLRLRTVVKHQGTQSQDKHTRGSTGSVTSEVGHIEAVQAPTPTSPAPSTSIRAKSPAETRSRSRGAPRSASDWI